jgi:hypothetical protein
MWLPAGKGRGNAIMSATSAWLHGEHLRCPRCQSDLWRVDHSPYYDEAFLYCDSCPRHAEVSYYDPHYNHAVPDETVRIERIETRLKPCVCGGHFRFAAARRCLTCWTPVIVADPAGVDLFYWEPYFDEETPLPPEGELKQAEQEMSRFARTADLWLDE